MTEEIKPSELWLRICAMPRPSKVIDFPRNDAEGKPAGQLAIWVLTQEEQMAAAAAAEMATRKIIKDAPKDQQARGYDDVYNNAAAIEVLFRACRRVEDLKKPFFPAPEAIRRALSIDEVGVLMESYFRVQFELGPIVAALSSDEVDAWIKRLGEGGSAFPLGSLSRDALKDLTLSLARRLYSLQTDTSSPGSPQDEATNIT